MSYTLVVFGNDNPVSRTDLLSGSKRNSKPNVQDIIDLYQLDQWQATKIPNYNEVGAAIDNSYHVRRENRDPNKAGHLSILSLLVRDSFSLLQYDEGVRWLEPFLLEELLTVDSTLMVGQGGKFSVCCNLNLEAEVAPGDTVNRFLLLALSHDSPSRGLYFCDTRPVCTNTLQVAKLEGLRNPGKSLKLDPSNPARSLEKAKQLIDLTKQRFYSDSLFMYKSFALLQLEDSQIDFIFRTILNMPLGKLTKVSDQKMDSYFGLKAAYAGSPGVELTAENSGWRVYNAVTHFTQSLGKTDQDSFQSDLFGTGQRLRKHTQDLLEDLLPSSAIPV